MRRKKLTEEQEIRRLMHADYVIASNGVMRQWLASRGYSHPLGALGLFDYRSKTVHHEQERTKGECSIVYAGALAMRKNAFILQIPDVISGYELHIYGNRSGLPSLKESPRVIFHDFMPADKFIESVQGDFGFVWDGDSLDSCTGSFGEYLRWNSPHKVSFYIRAGLPVVVWREAALASIVEKEGIGLCIDSIRQLGERLAAITPEQHATMLRNVSRVSQKMSEGGFLRNALQEAMLHLKTS
jgi:hypothetical protein